MYFDYAAATPVDPKVMKAMTPFFSEKFYNPSAIYLDGRSVKSHLELARQKVASTIGATPGEIIFTAGATEANNLVILGTSRKNPKNKILISAIEHSSVMEPASKIMSDQISVTPKGIVDTDKLSRMIDDSVVLVSVMYANNELGTIQPIKEIASIVKKVREDRLNRSVKTPILLHTDASSAGNYLDISVSRLGVDLMTLSAGKTYGPKQSGCLYMKAGVSLEPIIYGGGQEFGLRSGTQNTTFAVGFAEALSLAVKKRQSETKRLMDIRDEFQKQIQANYPKINLTVTNGPRLPNFIHFSLLGIDGETAVMMLDEMGIQIATGAACGVLKDGRNHVLSAIGLDETSANNSVRISMGRFTTRDDAKKLLSAIAKIIEDKY